MNSSNIDITRGGDKMDIDKKIETTIENGLRIAVGLSLYIIIELCFLFMLLLVIFTEVGLTPIPPRLFWVIYIGVAFLCFNYLRR